MKKLSKTAQAKALAAIDARLVELDAELAQYMAYSEATDYANDTAEQRAVADAWFEADGLRTELLGERAQVEGGYGPLDGSDAFSVLVFENRD